MRTGHCVANARAETWARSGKCRQCRGRVNQSGSTVSDVSTPYPSTLSYARATSTLPCGSTIGTTSNCVAPFAMQERFETPVTARVIGTAPGPRSLVAAWHISAPDNVRQQMRREMIPDKKSSLDVWYKCVNGTSAFIAVARARCASERSTWRRHAHAISVPSLAKLCLTRTERDARSWHWALQSTSQMQVDLVQLYVWHVLQAQRRHSPDSSTPEISAAHRMANVEDGRGGEPKHPGPPVPVARILVPPQLRFRTWTAAAIRKGT